MCTLFKIDAQIQAYICYTIQKTCEGTDFIHITNNTKATIQNIIEQEQPDSILAIGEGASFCTDFFPWEQSNSTFSKPKIMPPYEVTRLTRDFSGLNQLLDADILFTSDEWLASAFYDVILVADLFESVPVPLALEILKKLLEKANKQVLVICPKLCVGTVNGINNGVHKYHPVVFRTYDFSYLLLGREHENQTQIYSFYPKRQSCRQMIAPVAVPVSGMKQTLHLAYILPDQDLTGGMKQLLMQIKEMHRRGHQVFVYTKSATAQSALPRWSDVGEEDIDGQFVLKPDENYIDHIVQADVIVLGWMEQVSEVRGISIPVFLWEQGSRQLFGDFGKPLASSALALARFRSYYKKPIHLLAVSPLVQTILKARFNRDSSIVSAAVDILPVLPSKTQNAIKQILLVGNAEQEFKNFSFAIRALMMAKDHGHKFEVQWIAQAQPAKDMIPKGFKIEYHIAPSQQKLADLYSAADIFFSHSLYESFSLPPLEAMAMETAVLAINNGGIETYAVHNENCLLCEQGDMPGFVKEIGRLLEDDELQIRLAANGRITANEYSAGNMCDSLENNIHKVFNKNM